MQEKRSSFTGKIGFVLAAAGSAVGLGNIWRFPYLAAKYGGGIFLLVYIALALTFGFSLMIAEIAIGRKTGLSPLAAFRALDKRFSFIGVLAVIVPAIILPYYSVIGGWVMKYIAGFVSGHGDDMAAEYADPNESYFTNYTATTAEPLLWFALFIGITALIVLLGVNKGIEKVSKIMMPALIVLVLFISIYSMFAVEGTLDGVVYYLKPDFTKFSIKTVVAAMGQLFYSMSLAMGIMITFGSYMKKDINIEKSTHQIEIFDTVVAFLSGLMIIPAVYAFGGEEACGASGPGLIFSTLPKIFDTMPGGAVIGAIFFIMVFFAALTSSISLMETVVATLLDKIKINRRMACVAVLLFSFALGACSSLGYSAWSGVELLGMQILDFFDFISNSILMPFVALATAIFVSFFLKPKTISDELEITSKFKSKKLFEITIKFIAPICLLTILVTSILIAAGVMNPL